jgi:uncharacterized protein
MKTRNSSKDHTIIGKILVGSRIHDLYNESSDYEYRGIHLSKLRSLVSPFKDLPKTIKLDAGDEDLSYELSEFCRLAVLGQPQILEILYSDNILTSSPLLLELKENRHKLLDSNKIYEYAKNFTLAQYQEMKLFEVDENTPKFAVSYLRVLWQTEEFLKTGELPCKLTGVLRDVLFEVKFYDYTKFEEIIPEIIKLFSEYQSKLTETFKNNQNKFKPDLEWIEKFLEKAYKNNTD